ncbi:MAG: hypothetical protein ACOC84_02385 [Actinomycetota bacterium]
MEKQKSYDPDRTVTINAGRGRSGGLVLGALGFLAGLAAIVGIGIVSIDVANDSTGGQPGSVQEAGTGGH